jgi:hypothetical protein
MICAAMAIAAIGGVGSEQAAHVLATSLAAVLAFTIVFVAQFRTNGSNRANRVGGFRTNGSNRAYQGLLKHAA